MQWPFINLGYWIMETTGLWVLSSPLYFLGMVSGTKLSSDFVIKDGPTEKSPICNKKWISKLATEISWWNVIYGAMVSCPVVDSCWKALCLLSGVVGFGFAIMDGIHLCSWSEIAGRLHVMDGIQQMSLPDSQAPFLVSHSQIFGIYPPYKRAKTLTEGYNEKKLPVTHAAKDNEKNVRKTEVDWRIQCRSIVAPFLFVLFKNKGFCQ